MAAGACYALVSIAWILGTDSLVDHLAATRGDVVLLSKYKGLGFVLAMSVLVAVLVYGMLRRTRQTEELLSQLRSDSVTGVCNRVALMQILQNRLAGSAREEVVLMLLDIRDLRRINLSLGRSAGDLVLQEVARRLGRCVRTGDLLARIDGGSFALLAREGTSLQRAQGLASRIGRTVPPPFQVDGIEVSVQLSIGLALAPRDGRSAGQLLDSAEQALHAARTGQEGGHVAQPPAGRSPWRGHLQLEASLRQALREKTLTVHYQPQVDIDSGRTVGAEALVRWQTSDGAWVSPAEFIPVAEACGLVGEVTRQVLDAAVAQWQRWRRAGHPSLRIAVNLSGLDLDSGGLTELVAGLLRRHDMPGECLTLELTETRLLENPETAALVLEELRALGCRVAIDDFGTGYSSLAYLARFPVDALKIDRSFVVEADRRQSHRTVLNAICSLARGLGLDLVAEGVERTEELQLVAGAGCRCIQGYLVAPALEADAFQRQFLDGRPVVLVPAAPRGAAREGAS